MPFRFPLLAAAVVALTVAGSLHAAPVNGKGKGKGGGATPSTAAAASYCSATGSPNAAGMTLGDVTFSGNTPSTAADDCFGIVSGNDANSDINALIGTGWGTGWALLAKDDAGGDSGSFGGVTFDLTAVGLGTDGGTWTLTASPADLLPLYVDFIVALKGSNEFALWLFDDAVVGGADGGAWTSVFTNSNDKLQGLSHLSLYVRQGAVPPGNSPGTPPGSPPGTVPEPSGLALAALALVAAGAARRRRRA